MEISDIRIYKNGTWHSLRGQRMYKNGGWQYFNTGSGIYKNGSWHVLKSLGSPWTLQHLFTLSINTIKQLPAAVCYLTADFKLYGVTTHTIRKDWIGLPINDLRDGEEVLAPGVSFNAVTVTFYTSVNIGAMPFTVTVTDEELVAYGTLVFTQNASGTILSGSNILSFGKVIDSATGAGNPLPIFFEVQANHVTE